MAPKPIKPDDERSLNAHIWFGYLFIIACSICSSPALAKEVTLQHQGLSLNALYEPAANTTPGDDVILITHGSLAHNNMEMIAYLRKQLHTAGHSTLAINLSLGLNQRHGMYDCKRTHRQHNEDAANEIGVWLAWLKKQGVNNVILLGHSRGGAQTALYAATHNNPQVKAVILLAPATRDNTSANTYLQRYGKPLAPALKHAYRLVRSGRPDAILEHVNLMVCRDTPVTASTFVSYYGLDAQTDTPSLIPKIKKPVLVLVAGNDQVVVGLDKKLAPYLHSRHLQMNIIEGSDHLFRDLNTDDAVDAISRFLGGK